MTLADFSGNRANGGNDETSYLKRVKVRPDGKRGKG